ncbi:flavodoxin, partial [Megasphaera massiliensis]|uniref:flavodoxin n=1 Tax=Megasphaera massiliensis TaxID=1232428 RepID=UPI002740B842
LTIHSQGRTWHNNLVDEGGIVRKHTILIAYFSHSGNTRADAQEIARQTGGDLFEIRTDRPYADANDPCSRQAQQQL